MYKGKLDDIIDKNKNDYLEEKPNSVVWEITKFCNKKCAFCYSTFINKNEMYLSLNELERGIEYLNKNNIEYVALSGGEPLTYPYLKDLLEMLKNNSKIITVITNGLLLNDTTLNMLIKYDCRIKISLDLKDDNYIRLIKLIRKYKNDIKTSVAITIYDQPKEVVIDCIHNIRKIYNGTIEVNYAIFKGSAKYSEEYVDNMVELSKFLISRIIKDDLEIEGQYVSVPIYNYFRLLSIKSFNCSIGRNIKIDIDGNILPCPFFTDNKFIVGNISNYKQINKNSHLIMIKEKLFDRMYRSDCNKCNLKYFCGGGCLICLEDDGDGVNKFSCKLNREIYRYLNNIFGLYVFEED